MYKAEELLASLPQEQRTSTTVIDAVINYDCEVRNDWQAIYINSELGSVVLHFDNNNVPSRENVVFVLGVYSEDGDHQHFIDADQVSLLADLFLMVELVLKHKDLLLDKLKMEQEDPR